MSAFTGERFLPTLQGELRVEHLHRYAVTLPLVRSCDVLDVACGEGYGSSMLASAARSVVGVDVDVPTVKSAAAKYCKQANLRFTEGNSAKLPLADASVDVVVSFETLEHTDRQEETISEFARVLRAHGKLVISSPNRPVYSGKLGNRNAFHVKELDRGEFEQLLRRQFPHVQLFGQRPWSPSLVYPIEQGPIERVDLMSEGPELTLGFEVAPPTDAVYFIAVCAREPLTTPQLAASCFADPRFDLFARHMEVAQWAQSAERDLIRLRPLVRLLHLFDRITSGSMFGGKQVQEG